MATEHPAVIAVRAKAEATLKDGMYGLATDVLTFAKDKPNGKPAAALLAIATPIGSIVLAIDLIEFPQAIVTVLLEVGVPPGELRTALERAQAAKAEQVA